MDVKVNYFKIITALIGGRGCVSGNSRRSPRRPSSCHRSLWVKFLMKLLRVWVVSERSPETWPRAKEYLWGSRAPSGDVLFGPLRPHKKLFLICKLNKTNLVSTSEYQNVVFAFFFRLGSYYFIMFQIEYSFARPLLQCNANNGFLKNNGKPNTKPTCRYIVCNAWDL